MRAFVGISIACLALLVGCGGDASSIGVTDLAVLDVALDQTDLVEYTDSTVVPDLPAEETVIEDTATNPDIESLTDMESELVEPDVVPEVADLAPEPDTADTMSELDACVPDCADKECGDDGCGADCGACGQQNLCVEGQCQCIPDCADKECGDDGCGADCGACGQQSLCVEGQCQCIPDCADKECGDDGCGADCGACGQQSLCEEGQCQCIPDCADKECGDDGCGADCGACGQQSLCVEGQCQCIPDCADKECGDDGCGADCGACGQQSLCVEGLCVCQPDCADKECGDDGCGADCGACGQQSLCEEGQCQCIPDCADKECGDDGCGVSCGTCQGVQSFCDAGSCTLPPDPEGTWRSVLFPKTWKPDFTGPDGMFVHDFSYAGYRNSEEAIPTLANAPVFSVTDHGAAPNQDADSTAGFQSALDAAVAAGGGVVFVPAGLYRCDGLLSVKASNVVLRGEGPQVSRIYFTRHDTMTGKAHISFTGSGVTDIETALAADGEARSFTIAVEDTSQLAVGNDISIGWVITDDFIAHHSMTGTWAAFNGTWQPFFRREIVAIDTDVTPHQVTLDVPLRYPALVADGATVRRETGYISEVAVEGLGLSNAVEWNQAWANERSHVLYFSFVKDGWIQNVETFESPISPSGGNGAHAHLQNSGLKIHSSKRFTVQDTVMEKSQNRGGGGCGYLFEVRVSNEILFVDCTARAGRHNFIQNWGFGVTGCVWLRCFSEDGFAVSLQGLPFIGQTGFSEFHHSLATGNLIDSSTFHDGFKAVNRQDWSTGAGHTATQNIFWNNSGNGKIHSRQWDWGCIIGTSGNLDAVTSLGGLFNSEAEGTEPEDFTEGLGQGETLYPPSLFEEQLLLRLGQ